MFRYLFLTLALASSAPVLACSVTQTYGTNYLAATNNCTGLVGGRVGQCAPMNAEGNWWSCQCYNGNGCNNASFQLASIQQAQMSCSCHALDRSNPYNEAACNALQVGTTCTRVGNIICIPVCQ